MTMDEGMISEWLKAEGDAVSVGEALAMVETEKVEAELEAPASGTLVKILVAQGETVPVGAPVGIIEGL
jgi:pyruvate/2-oxoglutarate dehydrogenase complex dihydrolipoamide acyltransferase (E2) component